MLLKLNEFVSFLQLDKVKLTKMEGDLVDIQILIKDKKKIHFLMNQLNDWFSDSLLSHKNTWVWQCNL